MRERSPDGRRRGLRDLMLIGALVAACRSAKKDIVPARASTSFPAVGLAVLGDTLGWCAAFPRDSAMRARDSAAAAPTGPLVAGDAVTIVFAGTTGAPSRRAIVGARRPVPCPTAFAQPRWETYVAYDLTLLDSTSSSAPGSPTVALAVASAAPWTRGADGRVRADLDGDGIPEEARRCAADEGEHFTLWSREPGGGWRLRAHEYFDWGALVEPTCQPGENGP